MKKVFENVYIIIQIENESLKEKLAELETKSFDYELLLLQNERLYEKLGYEKIFLGGLNYYHFSRGVAVRRIVATADMAAGPAQTQMDP